MATNLKPNQQCSTCAFRKDKNGASGEPDNALRGTIAALGAVPFLCHHAPDGFELDWRHGPLEFLKSMRSRRDRRVCAGWKAQVRIHHQEGRFGDCRAILRHIATHAMQQLDIFISAKTKEQKNEAHIELKSALDLLGKRSKRKLTTLSRGGL